MVDLLNMLPLLRGWQWEVKATQTPFILAAGETKEMYSKKIPGWLVSSSVAFSSKKGEIKINYDAYLETKQSPENLYTYGLITPNGSTWTPKYEATPIPTYSIACVPYNYLPFREQVKTAVINPTALPIYCYNYAHLILIVVDQDKFEEGLRRIIGSK